MLAGSTAESKTVSECLSFMIIIIIPHYTYYYYHYFPNYSKYNYTYYKLHRVLLLLTTVHVCCR